MYYYRSIYTIAKYTFFKTVRDHFFLFLLIGLIIFFGLSRFTAELALTEGIEIQLALLSAGLRLFAVSIASLSVVTSIIREFNDKEVELVFSFPCPRSCYYLGKLFGFSFAFSILVLLITVVLTLYSATDPLLIWSTSLFCEIVIMITFSILCCLVFSNITIAFSAAFSFYLLARNIAIIQAIGDSAILEKEIILDMINMIIDFIAYVLPDLHLFTQTGWLVYQDVTTAQLSLIIVQTFIYTVFISSVILFDLYKREL